MIATHKRSLLSLLIGLSLTAPLLAADADADRWEIPVAVKTLDNGLTVVVSEDRSAPVVGVSVVYKVGMRLEPKNRSGFAHLFEHLMFEGSPNAPEGAFDKVITGGGGRNNGSTRPDYTNYIEVAPVSALEPILWLEADRMTTLDFNEKTLKNQQDVVKEEIRVNVKNQPYGGFMWIDIGQQAFQKWENNHDGYGSFVDLENASLDDVRAFHRDYYGPNNAVVSMAGDISAEEGFKLAEKYFGKIERRETPPHPDVSEPLNTKEKRITQSDALAQVPAVAVAWKIAERGSADQAPFAVLAEVLAGGDASRMYQGLVKGKEMALNIDFLFGLTGPFEYDGPTLLTLFALYKPNVTSEQLIDEMDVLIAKIVKDGVSDEELARVKTGMLSDWNNEMESFLNRADKLALFQALWGDAKVVNQIPGKIEAVTSDDLKRVAKNYLIAANRTVIDRKPAAMLATKDAPKLLPRTEITTMTKMTVVSNVIGALIAPASILTALVIGALIAPVAIAADLAPPKNMPAYGADKPLPVPEIAKQTLDNGLTVWVVPRDGVPRVDYVLAFKNAGLAADPADRPALASMVAAMLSEGTEKLDSKAIAEAAQSYGGSVGAGAGNDGLTVYANATASNAEPMLQLLSQIARTPTFPENEVALAKANALQGLKAAEAQPGFRAERAMLTAVYGDHPYSRTQPTEASINAVTREQLQQTYKQRLRPDQALLVITGRIDAESGFKLAQAAFGDWKASGEALKAIAASPAESKPSFVHLQREGSVQSTVRIGRPAIPATHVDYIPLRLASTLLGGGFSSRLMQNLREDKGYTYGAGVGYRAQIAGGAVIASADVRNEVTGKAVGEFFAEYKRIGSEPVSAAELDMNKRYVAGGYLISNQLQAAVAGTLANNWLVGLPPEFLGEFVPKIREVDAKAVQAVGRKYFDPKQQSIVVVGDKAVVEQLKDYGKFEDVN